jgi:putative ABC transport system ATP-binding protein
MIELKEVSKVYNQGRANEVAAIRDVSLTIKANAVTVLKGSSGSGKTTLLTLIGCLARPTSGRVRLHGEVVSSMPEKFLAELRRTTFGFVFQQHNLIRGITALQNIMLPAFPLGIPHARLASKALDLLAQLGLEHRAGLTVEHLSGGEAQRVAIARALINSPDVIIADEPTANLDTSLTHQFLEIIARFKREGKTVLMTSHDPRIWQAPLVDTVVTLADGRTVAA